MIAGIVAGGNQAGAPGSTYLDDLAVLPRAAYAVKKLIRTANLCLRVRNNTTDVETDIGFDGDMIDTTAIDAALGTDEGYVVTWYDQTGNGEDATQITEAQQPEIDNGTGFFGYLNTIGNNRLDVTSLTMGTPYLGIYQKGKLQDLVSGTGIMFENSPNVAAAADGAIIFTSSATIRIQARNGTSTAKTAQFTPSPALNVLGTLAIRIARTSTAGDTETQLDRDGVPQTATMIDDPVGGLTGNFASMDYGIFSRPSDPNPGVKWQGYAFVIYTADTSAIASSIETIIA